MSGGQGEDVVPSRSREWRVRSWVRALAVVASVLLAVGASPVMERRLNPEGLTPGDQAFGYLFAIASILATYFLAFRPRVQIDAQSTVEVRNPLRTARFAANDVAAVTPTPYGVKFVLHDGRQIWTIGFQDTRALSGQPRWFDLAEAVTGERPPDPHRSGRPATWDGASRSSDPRADRCDDTPPARPGSWSEVAPALDRWFGEVSVADGPTAPVMAFVGELLTMLDSVEPVRLDRTRSGLRYSAGGRDSDHRLTVHLAHATDPTGDIDVVLDDHEATVSWSSAHEHVCTLDGDSERPWTSVVVDALAAILRGEYVIEEHWRGTHLAKVQIVDVVGDEERVVSASGPLFSWPFGRRLYRVERRESAFQPR